MVKYDSHRNIRRTHRDRGNLMIGLRKYLGLEPDVMLMEDAPLLLAEVKRLQDYNAALLNWVMNHLDRDEDEVKEMIYE